MPSCQCWIFKTPHWDEPPSLTLFPVIHSCDWGWEWRRRSVEKWNREDPGRGLEHSAHPPPPLPPRKTLLKFFMATFNSFNPKTLYISTFSHVAASNTSTPSSPSQSWSSGCTHWRRGDDSKGDPQVDPPTHRHTQTQKTHPWLQGFGINPKAGENDEGGGGGGRRRCCRNADIRDRIQE